MSDKVKQHNWGYEASWASAESYGAKMLMFPKIGAKTDMHFMSKTDRTWFVNSGSFSVRWIDTLNGRVFEQKLTEGNVFEVPALRPCSLESLQENSSITEVNSGSSQDTVHTVFPAEKIGI